MPSPLWLLLPLLAVLPSCVANKAQEQKIAAQAAEIVKNSLVSGELKIGGGVDSATSMILAIGAVLAGGVGYFPARALRRWAFGINGKGEGNKE